MSGKEAVRKNLVDLNSALSAHQETFRSIVLKCQEEDLITTGVGNGLLDPLIGRSIQDRASQLVINLQTTIELQPACLDTFLCILKDKGGVPGRTVAQNIAKEYGLQNLPKYNSSVSGTVAVSVDPLDERPTLYELTEHANVGTKWRQVGIQLKLDVKELNAIEDENKKVADRVSKMYELWLNTTLGATRRQLLEVLKKDSIKELTLASEYVKHF